MSLSHALSLAESVRRKLDCAKNDPANLAATPQEAAEGELEKAKAKAALTSSIALVNQTLAAVRKAAPKTPPSEKKARRPQNPLRLSRAAARSASATAQVASFAAASDPALESVMQAMSAEGMKPSVTSLQDMATAVEPIIDKFDDVLKKPYLKNYNATLNTVPVVGLKGNQIMYIETQSDVKSGSGLKYSWSPFTDLPSNAKVTAGNRVHMFPYKGDFYLSVGRAVWKKAHISDRDPALQGAVNNWPGLYVKDWTYVGDSVLPTSDLAGVVPFAVLSADRQQVAFHLVTLDTNGSVFHLTNDEIAQGNKYQPLQYTTSSGSPQTPPKFTKIAYWDGHIVGVDGESNSWNIEPKWDAGTYTIADKVAIEPVTEFTANDSGLVGLRSDGYLYRRIVEAPPPQSDEDATLVWQRWIPVDGVTDLGVASPGVLLDMNLLTSTLRSRYIDVQTSVYPVVNRLRAYGVTHVVWLNNVRKDADAWQNASTPEQQALAIKNARSFVAHAQTWSKIVSDSISGAKDSVNIMTLQLHDVRVQLEQQLVLLKDKLVGLQNTLDAQQETLSVLKAAFWGTIAATLFGVAMAIVGTITANPWILAAAGILFVGGLVATIALSVQISELAASIAGTEAQIRDVKTAIEQLSTIVSAFTDLDDLYGILNMFWGRMANDAADIKAMDEATEIMIGAEILADTSSIDAAREVTQNMADACQVYLDVLNKQGIKIPGSRALRSSTLDTLSHHDQVDVIIAQAIKAISVRDDVSYEKLMKQAAFAHIQALVDVQKATIASGMWFDVPALRSTAAIWQGSRAFTRSVNLSGLRSAIDSIARAIVRSADSMDGALDEVRPYVQQMLTEIISLGDTIQGWTARFPTLPTDPQEKAEFEKLQTKAISTCETAQNKAALANNKFADFTNDAREYQQGLDRKIQENYDKISSEQRRAEEEIRHLSPPWYVIIGGVLAVAIWMDVETSKIRSRLSNTVSDLNKSIAQFKDLQSSGITFEGNTQTWIQMSQTVSGNLGGIYNILTGVWGQLIEDPVLYAEFMSTEWDEVVSNARDVLTILGGGSRSLSTSVVRSFAVPRALLLSAASDKEVVLGALSPNSNLGPGIRTQAESARQAFTSLDVLLKSPYLKDIIGYWADGNTERRTLYDVVTSLRTEYVQMVATEYETIQNISSLALLQKFRARNVAEGKLSLENFVQFTAQSIRVALQAAESTSSQFGSAAQQFQLVLDVIDSNIKDITEKISGLDDDIEQANEALRNKILWVIADTIALAFAAATVLVAFGVVGPVAAVVTLSAQIGAAAGATSAAIKLALDSLSLAEIVQTIEALKATRSSLDASVKELQSVRPLFGDVVNGVNDLTGNVTVMYDTLNHVLSQLELIGEVSFTAEDAVMVENAWSRVGEDTQAWMDVINSQGISPITFSVTAKVL